MSSWMSANFFHLHARRCDKPVASHINSTDSHSWAVVSTFAPESRGVPPYPAWLLQAAS